MKLFVFLNVAMLVAMASGACFAQEASLAKVGLVPAVATEIASNSPLVVQERSPSQCKKRQKG